MQIFCQILSSLTRLVLIHQKGKVALCLFSWQLLFSVINVLLRPYAIKLATL